VCPLSSLDQPRDHRVYPRDGELLTDTHLEATTSSRTIAFHIKNEDITRLTTEVVHAQRDDFLRVLRAFRRQAHLQEHRPAALTPVLTYLRTYAAGRICEHLRELSASIAEFDAKFTHTGVFRHHWHLSLT